MRFLLIGCVALGCLGCSGKDTPPRSRDDLFAEKQNLNRLYITNISKTRIIAPKHKGTFVDESTKEECWPALQCVNPDCPGRTPEGNYLFTTYDVRTYNGCPACAKKRDYKHDSKQQIADNLKFIQPYELPDVAAKAKALDEEIARSFEWERFGKKK